MNFFFGISFAFLGLLFLLGIGFALGIGLFAIAFAEEVFVSAETGVHCLSEPAQIGDCFLPITSNILLNETVTITNNMDRELIIKPFYQDRQGQTEHFNNGIVLLSSETTVINFTRVGHYSFYDDNRKSMLGEIYVYKVPVVPVEDDDDDDEDDDLQEFSDDTHLLLSSGGTHNPVKLLKTDILSILIRDIYEKYPEQFVDSYKDRLREAGIIE